MSFWQTTAESSKTLQNPLNTLNTCRIAQNHCEYVKTCENTHRQPLEQDSDSATVPRQFRDSSDLLVDTEGPSVAEVSRKCRGTCPCPVSGSCLPPLKSLLSVGMDHSCQFLLAFVCFAAFGSGLSWLSMFPHPFWSFRAVLHGFHPLFFVFHNLYTFYLVLHAFHVIFDGFAMFLYISACFGWI